MLRKIPRNKDLPIKGTSKIRFETRGDSFIRRQAKSKAHSRGYVKKFGEGFG